MYYIAGSCVSSFDEDAECMISELPYRDVTDFAQAAQLYVSVTRSKFIRNVVIPKSLKRLVNKKTTKLLYDKKNDIVIMYDMVKDIHYFFLSI
jgi:hypothetical protein